MPYHKRARRDDNHAAIEAAFRQLGCSFIDTSQSPCGFDGLVGYGGICIPVEIKNPEAENWKKLSKKTRTATKLLTKNEKKIHESWTGGSRLVMDMNDVASTVALLRRWHGWITRAAATELVAKA